MHFNYFNRTRTAIKFRARALLGCLLTSNAKVAPGARGLPSLRWVDAANFAWRDAA